MAENQGEQRAFDPIPMSAPDIVPEDIAAVTEALRSGTLSLGPLLKRFEHAVADYVGTKHAIGVSSGTAGLHLALCAADIGEGAEVITTPFSFIASANCILYTGARPVFVDIDEETLTMSTVLAANAVTSRTRAILPVHVFGTPCDMDSLSALAGKNGLTIIEDACEALGSVYGGRKIGGLGKAGVFAFYANKQMTTGEGGMIVTDDDVLATDIRALRNQGRAATGDRLHHDRVGYNYRLGEMNAALGVSQMRRLQSLLTRRRQVAGRYHALLGAVPGVRILLQPDADRSWFVYVVGLEPGIDRDRVARELQARGIPSRNYFPPIHLQPVYRERFGFRGGEFPVTEKLGASTLALPFYSNLPEASVVRVVECLDAAIRAGRR